jgi:hypothetical protein
MDIHAGGMGAMTETDDTQQLPRMKRWVILLCALVAVPASVVLETMAGFGLPGGRLMFYLAPWNGPHVYGKEDFAMSLLAGWALDSTLCFALLAGVYWLVYPFFGKRKYPR